MEENFTNLPLNLYKSLQLLIAKCFFKSLVFQKNKTLEFSNLK
jgi:hypothetical protein